MDYSPISKKHENKKCCLIPFILYRALVGNKKYLLTIVGWILLEELGETKFKEGSHVSPLHYLALSMLNYIKLRTKNEEPTTRGNSSQGGH